MRFGIDFGTTRTVVAAVTDGRHPVVTFDDHGEFRSHVPGIAALRGGELLVGWQAAHALAAGEAEHAIRSIKRVAQTQLPDDPVPGLPGITALELVTAFLRELRRLLIEHSTIEIPAGTPLEAMVSVPANAASRQRWLTLEAFRRAGFAPVGMVNEPTAAAIELAHLHLGELGKRSPKRYVVVYDLGGGTFDTSAVSLVGRRFDLIAAEGIARLGGDDFDEIVLDLACAQLGVSPSGAARAAALERAREAKESLKPASKKLLVELGPLGSATIDAAELYARCEPLIERTLDETDRLFARLRDAGVDSAGRSESAPLRFRPDDPRELGGLYLVGGAAAFPAVARKLRARFGKKLQLAPQPFAATAVGLAIAADPAAQVMVRETATRHFGVWREAAGGADKIFDPLIGKGAAGTVERRYRPTHAVGHLRFLECGALDPAGQPVHDLVPWTDIYFPYDPALADNKELAARAAERRPDLQDLEIAERYTYAPDGTIKVQIENISRGYARTYELGALR
ncbi:MAG TPA: Hsp70 family protein [Kofleriaceae bacterium]|nr:Hsp70 family protein [Kofleriaceae bacterium]